MAAASPLKIKSSHAGLDAGPAPSGFAITPHDTIMAKAARSIYVGGAGDVKIKDGNGNDLTFKAVPVGSILPIEATLVYNTGTTATFLIGLD